MIRGWRDLVKSCPPARNGAAAGYNITRALCTGCEGGQARVEEERAHLELRKAGRAAGVGGREKFEGEEARDATVTQTAAESTATRRR